jgi:hypothetical protein
MTIERKVTSSSRNASDRTNAKTIGALDFIRSLKSCVPAAMPVTYACCTPGAEPTVASTMPPPRSAASASSDALSVPSPFIGMSTVATRLSGLTVTSSGPFILPVANTRSPSCFVAAAICGVVTSSACTTTTAGICPPGKAVCIRS